MKKGVLENFGKFPGNFCEIFKSTYFFSWKVFDETDRSVQLQSFTFEKSLNLVRIQLNHKLPLDIHIYSVFKRKSNKPNAIGRLQRYYKDQQKGNS